MTPFPLAEKLVYAVVILLMLIVLALTAISPAEYRETKVIYQAF